MSDEELIARLHLPWPKDANVGEVTLPIWVLALTAEAADRSEELEAKLEKSVDALSAFRDFENSVFYGIYQEKNKRAAYRGVKRKLLAALKILEEK